MAGNRINVGDLRQRLVWQTATYTLDTVNQQVLTWTDVGTYWGKVEPLTGMEAMNARQLKATTSFKITTRNFGPVKPTDRFLFEATGRVFNVDSVFRIDERNAYLALHCTELKVPQ